MNEIQYITNGLSGKDSADLANSFIHEWIRNTLEFEKANIGTDPILENMVEHYRKMLYVHKYEQKLLDNKHYPDLSDSIISEHYHSHLHDFILSDNLIKGAFIILYADAPNQTKLIQNLKLICKGDSAKIEEVEKYAYQYGTNFDIFLNEWRSLNQFRLLLPIHYKDLVQKIHYSTLIECNDSTYTYILLIKDKCLVGEIMHKELASEEIRQKLIKESEHDFIEKERDALYDEAMKKKKIIFYER